MIGNIPESPVAQSQSEGCRQRRDGDRERGSLQDFLPASGARRDFLQQGYEFRHAGIPHSPRFIRRFPLPPRAAQAGPSGLPVLFDKTGRLVQVAPPQIGPNGLPLIRNNAGDLIEFASATIGADRNPVFMERTGNVITHIVLKNS